MPTSMIFVSIINISLYNKKIIGWLQRGKERGRTSKYTNFIITRDRRLVNTIKKRQTEDIL